MTSRPRAQRLAEHLIRRACRRLPGDTRDDRYREWAAELPAILHDPDIRFRLHRSARALLYAADHTRSTRRLPRAAANRDVRARARNVKIKRNIAHGIPVAGIVAVTVQQIWTGQWMPLIAGISGPLVYGATRILTRSIRQRLPRRRRAGARVP
jgi:hypothetical protein